MLALLAKHGLRASLTDHFTDPIIKVAPKDKLTPLLRKIITERREEVIDELYAARCDEFWPSSGEDSDRVLEKRREKVCETHPISVLSLLIDHPNGLTLPELAYFANSALPEAREALQVALNRGTARIIYRNLIQGHLYSAYER